MISCRWFCEYFFAKASKMTIEYFAESNPATRTLPRSLATKAGNFVFISGQIARDEDGSIVTGGMEAHARQTLKNVARVLALVGCTLEDVVKTTVWLEDARDFDEFNRIYGEFFPGNKPSRSTLQATNMAGTKIEIEVIAYKP
jgi:reactive intermediate/imine deaminase